MKNKYFLILIIFFFFAGLDAQVKEIKSIPAQIDFGVRISDWDGFGFNYVETTQTRNYADWIDGDPNPGCAFRINADGSYEVQVGYYFYIVLAVRNQYQRDKQ